MLLSLQPSVSWYILKFNNCPAGHTVRGHRCGPHSFGRRAQPRLGRAVSDFPVRNVLPGFHCNGQLVTVTQSSWFVKANLSHRACAVQRHLYTGRRGARIFDLSAWTQYWFSCTPLVLALVSRPPLHLRKVSSRAPLFKMHYEQITVRRLLSKLVLRVLFCACTATPVA